MPAVIPVAASIRICAVMLCSTAAFTTILPGCSALSAPAPEAVRWPKGTSHFLTALLSLPGDCSRSWNCFARAGAACTVFPC